jgi:hypothetical protein
MRMARTVEGVVDVEWDLAETAAPGGALTGEV